MTVEQQIDAFVQGIHCATTQAIAVNLAGDQAVCTMFDNYYNAVASKLELAMALTGWSSNSVIRNVNQLSKNNIPKQKNAVVMIPKDEHHTKYYPIFLQIIGHIIPSRTKNKNRTSSCNNLYFVHSYIKSGGTTNIIILRIPLHYHSLPNSIYYHIN